ncbi:unnamed protein product [Vitrella brassicaformis CCMP3155]|uniref:SHSP domain-containing protein n=2 Tax=Vitrella brassicaformis TaxID=1169539 RepID=A0A0G4GN63_VITBC|nr:unnamed protein product [Vitrella brassicaformis CCMP3155]|mmetsp:Transcript_6698/g.16225  ORF Transcript_6698/g.16225 Transcript_6698/m.16225 type:complete len:186 (+) Transcript_6698:184-741(+)|eukprot:CEM31639.1 unnamed protein product [Vitrella brassicaformis CCMP3155]
MFRYDPFGADFRSLGRELRQMQRQMDSLFNDVSRIRPGTGAGAMITDQPAEQEGATGQIARHVSEERPPSSISSLLTWAPRMDISHDDNNNVIVAAELPGMTKEDIKLDFQDGLLSISGESKKEDKKEGEGWLYEERQVGRFHRCLRLPNTNEAAITAQYENGVLKVTCPQKEPIQPVKKQITIQ